MSEVKHTPGPWTAENDDGHRCQESGSWHIHTESQILPVASYCTEDDARLIAAAPALLDVAKRALEDFQAINLAIVQEGDWIDLPTVLDTAQGYIKAALAQVEGGGE